MAAERCPLCHYLCYVMFSTFFAIQKSNAILQNGTVIQDGNVEYNIAFDLDEIVDLFVGDTQVVKFNISSLVTELGSVDKTLTGQSGPGSTDIKPRNSELGNSFIRVTSENPEIADIVGKNEFPLKSVLISDADENDTVSFEVAGIFLGRTRLKFSVNGTTQFYQTHNEIVSSREIRSVEENPSYGLVPSATNSYIDDTWQPLPIIYKVSVIRKERIIDTLFIVVVAILVFFGNIGMGCKVELDVVKETFKRPIAPSIGFASQYIVMPLTSFAVVKMLGLEGGVALGMFALGCSPGGSTSNVYSFLLNGDVSLSITMTVISTFASLGMIPLWLFTLGRLITGRDSNLHIPIQNIVISLVSLLIPVAIGIVIRRKRPRAADIFVRCLRPFFCILILFLFSFGVYTNIYIFRLITPTLVLAGCILPYVGFGLGALVAFAFRQPWKRIYTIAIETGLQNTGIPIILMKFSLDQPEADLSIVSPIVAAMFAPMPLWIAVATYEIRKRCCKKNKMVVNTSDPEELNNAEVSKEDTEKELLESQDYNLNRNKELKKDDGKLVVMFENDTKS